MQLCRGFSSRRSPTFYRFFLCSPPGFPRLIEMSCLFQFFVIYSNPANCIIRCKRLVQGTCRQAHAENSAVWYGFIVQQEVWRKGCRASDNFFGGGSLKLDPKAPISRRRRRRGVGIGEIVPPPQPTRESGGASWAPWVRSGATAAIAFQHFLSVTESFRWKGNSVLSMVTDKF